MRGVLLPLNARSRSTSTRRRAATNASAPRAKVTPPSQWASSASGAPRSYVTTAASASTNGSLPLRLVREARSEPVSYRKECECALLVLRCYCALGGRAACVARLARVTATSRVLVAETLNRGRGAMRAWLNKPWNPVSLLIGLVAAGFWVVVERLGWKWRGTDG